MTCSYISHPNFNHMSRQVADTHGGSSIANALRKELNKCWQRPSSKPNDLACSLNQQIPIKANIPNGADRSIPTEVDETIQTEADRSIRLEAELCLLICSMFPEDFRLPIEDLVICGLTLKLFKDVHNMLQARYRVHDLIKIINHQLPPYYLVKLCLWEDKYGNQYVKVLDCAHDLAKSISSKYQLVTSHESEKRKWPNTKCYEYCYGFSLVLDGINELPVDFKGKKLASLHHEHREYSQSIQIDFFEAMKELLVLSFDPPELPRAFNVLRNLTTLHLKVLELVDLSWIGGLLNLELLSISTSSLTDVPREMGQLGNLRLLDLSKMKIAFIPPSVLSRMLKLEELYLPLNFKRWECRAREQYGDYDEWELWEEDSFDVEERTSAITGEIIKGERINASLSEISSLSLYTLQISIPKASVLPKASLILKNVQRFKIIVPNNLKYQPFGKDKTINELQLTGDAYDIKESGICDLMSKTEYMNLTRVRNLKSIMYQLEDNDFPKLQKIIISECDDLEYIVDTTEKLMLSEDGSLFWKLECLHLSMLSNLKKIWHGGWTNCRWFENLSHISIRFCNKLKYVFPLSIVRGWILLKRIEILDCNEMEGIFYQDKEEDSSHSIEELDLHSLKMLVGFLKKDTTIGDTNLSLTNHENIASNSEESTNESIPRLKKCGVDDAEFVHPPVSIRRGKQKHDVTQQLVSDKQIYCAFSSKLAEKLLQNLKRLKIAFCDALDVIFSYEENNVTAVAFNALEELELYGLRNLMHIWFLVPPQLIAFQNLQLLVLSECHNLYLFSPRVARLLVQLQKVYINRCEKMEEIIAKENEKEVEDKIIFPQLQLLELQHTPNLRIFSNGIYAIELPLLESLKFNQCNKIKSFSCGPLRTPMLETLEINGRFFSSMGDLNATIKRYMGNGFKDSSINVANHSSTISTINSHSTRGPSNSSYSTTIDSPSRSGSMWTSHFSTFEQEISNDKILEGPNYMKEFTFANLNSATKNFSSDSLLGEGYFSKLYKGWLDGKTFAPSRTGSGMVVAIKKLSSKSLQRLREWESEVKFLERIWHPNVIKLLGHCVEENELFLVYKFMQRGSLDDHLFRRRRAYEILPWDMRLKIAIGVARGLDFLHRCGKNVIHRNLTASNVLLDGNYNAKISNFGLAKWGPSGGDSHVATEVMGTPGYAAPEYVATGHLYVKSDVYSFGVVLLELMTGLKVLDEKRPYGKKSLVDWSKPFLLQMNLKNIVDTGIVGQYSFKAMLKAAQLTLKCLESDPKFRPSMDEVLDVLEQIATIEEKRGFYHENRERH